MRVVNIKTYSVTLNKQIVTEPLMRQAGTVAQCIISICKAFHNI